MNFYDFIYSMTLHFSFMFFIYMFVFAVILTCVYRTIIDTWLSKNGIISYDYLLKNFIQVVSKNNFFMNYGYWSSPEMDLLQANKALINLIIEKSGLIEKNNVKILDVGCGYGEQDFEWANILHESNIITAIDISKTQINLAQEKCKRSKLDSRIFFEHTDALFINKKYANGEFNTVISVESAFHYSDRKQFFKAVYDVLEENGTFVICDIILNDSYNGGILHRSLLRTFSDFLHIPKINLIKGKEWEKNLLDSGFKIIESINITDKTFNPYYKNFFDKYIENYSLPSYISNGLYGIFSYLQPFSYMVAVCKKNITV